MSLTLGFTRFVRLSRNAAQPAARPSVIAALTTRFVAMRRQAMLRREIEKMDDHMLADIGVSRAQVLFDTRR